MKRKLIYSAVNAVIMTALAAGYCIIRPLDVLAADMEPTALRHYVEMFDLYMIVLLIAMSGGLILTVPMRFIAVLIAKFSGKSGKPAPFLRLFVVSQGILLILSLILALADNGGLITAVLMASFIPESFLLTIISAFLPALIRFFKSES